MGFENNAASYLEISLHEIGREECLPNKVFHYTPKEYHLFHYVVRGKGTFTIRGVTYHLKRGDCFYIPPREVPTYSPDPEDPWIYEWVGIGGSRATSIIESVEISGSSPVIHDEGLHLKPYFDGLATEYLRHGKMNLYCLGQALCFLGYLIQGLRGETEEEDPKQAHLQMAKEYINNNYQFPITVADVAKNVGITANYLSSLFHDYEGMSTKSYLIKVRMEKAATILRSGAYKIKEAGMMSGYKDQLHFSSEFRKYHGVCPSEFLRKESKQ